MSGNERPRLHYYRVSTESVVRERHERLVVAHTPEQALREYERGTAWPKSYDTRHLETIESFPTVVEIDEREERYNHFDDPAEFMMWRTFLAEELEDQYPYPEVTDPEELKFLNAGGDDDE